MSCPVCFCILLYLLSLCSLSFGGPAGIRTPNQGIMSPLLKPLSYRPFNDLEMPPASVQRNAAAGGSRSGRIFPKPCKHCMAWGVERKTGGEGGPALFCDPWGGSAILSHFRRRVSTGGRLILRWNHLPPQGPFCAGKTCAFTHPDPPGRLEISGVMRVFGVAVVFPCREPVS